MAFKKEKKKVGGTYRIYPEDLLKAKKKAKKKDIVLSIKTAELINRWVAGEIE